MHDVTIKGEIFSPSPARHVTRGEITLSEISETLEVVGWKFRRVVMAAKFVRKVGLKPNFQQVLKGERRKMYNEDGEEASEEGRRRERERERERESERETD